MDNRDRAGADSIETEVRLGGAVVGGALVLDEAEVTDLLAGREAQILHVVRRAYELHDGGETVVPESVFLRLSDGSRERFIALPAYLGGEFDVAGMKWIASFPGNRERGLERASGTVILNSSITGEPLAILGGATISARRTAASATLAAGALWHGGPPDRAGVIGCGRISFETVGLLRHLWPCLSDVVAYDSEPAQLDEFRDRCGIHAGLRVTFARGVTELLAMGIELLVIATTAIAPHIDTFGPAPPRVVLHISLRDLAPSLVARCCNVVDDLAHVCRHQTSVELARQELGHRDFVEATLGQLLRRTSVVAVDDRPVVFSPFGLGILDVALGKLVYDRARLLGLGGTCSVGRSEPPPEAKPC